MAQPLANKVVIVTGASSGIGAATAYELARQGARVVLAARRIDLLEAQVEAIKQAGGLALAIPTDVTDALQVKRLVERTHEAFGRVDVIVNNAGVNWMKPLVETSAEEMSRLLQVNLLGVMLLTREVLLEMQQRRNGVIISVGSVASHVAIEPLYSATKFGVRGFSLALRRQLAGSGIAVSLVTPGNIRTAMTSKLQERMPEPGVVAETIARLIVRPRREVIVPHKYQAVVWLDRLLPGVADFAFHWRHRGDHKYGSGGNLPAYAQPGKSEENGMKTI
jgi:NAD(P)-dependent dehydrogenase (short-subunit alcohol dehydrogenase family)